MKPPVPTGEGRLAVAERRVYLVGMREPKSWRR